MNQEEAQNAENPEARPPHWPFRARLSRLRMPSQVEVDVQPEEFSADVGGSAADVAPEIAADVAADEAASVGKSAVADAALPALAEAIGEAEVETALQSIAATVAEQAVGRGATAGADSGIELFSLAAGPGEEEGLTTAAAAVEFGGEGTELASLASVDGALAETGPVDVVIIVLEIGFIAYTLIPGAPGASAIMGTSGFRSDKQT